MADVNGLGPYVGVYLQQEYWSVEAIGAARVVLTASSTAKLDND
jgi:hypothetical protein